MESTKSTVREENAFPYPMGSSRWSKNYTDMTQINRRKSYLILKIFELYIHEKVRDPTYIRGS